jgi:catechol 2,3-dioxygenase-like lactoylglutathione lyase family enzyme
MVQPRRIGGVELPPMDQLSFVVRDLDDTMRRYAPLFGPFQVMDSELVDVDYRGRRASCKLRLAFGRSGPLEIELIEVLEGECIHREFLERGREGPHHVRFPVADLEAAVAALEREGLRRVYGRRLSESLAFAYVESDDGMLFELLEMKGSPSPLREEDR